MIKVRDIAFVRFGAPDLDQMERFTNDFGFVTSERAEQRLYSRGTDPDPYIHVAERGEPGFRGVAFEAASAEDLTAASRLEGASPIEPLDGPGGGRRVRFTDPDGNAVELVHGRVASAALKVEHAAPLNCGSDRRRFNVLQRIPKGPAQIKRIGHAVLLVSDFRTVSGWYESRFGFLRSDAVFLGDNENLIAAFLRCDQGKVPVDHHTFAVVGMGEPGLEHAAFEVEDFDAVMAGHDHMRDAGYNHKVGVGRHYLGSQVFDYWHDPFGHVLEHFTDGDLLDASAKPGLADPATTLGAQWGTPARD